MGNNQDDLHEETDSEYTRRKIEESQIIKMIREQTEHLVFDKDNSEEKKESSADKVDLDTDKLEEKKESTSDKVDRDINNSEEKNESKWDKIDWNKQESEEKNESKWDKIDWSKHDSEEKNESKWDKIDWSKSESEEKKEKTKEYISDEKEIHNSHKDGTVTTTVQNDLKVKSDLKSDQEVENKNKKDKEEIIDWELVNPEGEQEKAGDSPDALKVRGELEEDGLVDYSEPFYYRYDSPELKSDLDLDEDFESNLEGESEKEFENLSEKEEIKADQELEIKNESYHDNEVKGEIKHPETRETLKRDLQVLNQEKLQPSKENIVDVKKGRDDIIREQYHQETGKRAIYAKQETIGFMEWKEKKELIEYKKTQLDKKATKDTQEIKEESVKYLIETVKEAAKNKFITEEAKVEILKSLKNYDEISDLCRKLENREINKYVFEKEIDKIEKELDERLRLGIFLFNNFEAFRKYYNDMIRRAGKRVAMVQIPQKTKRFLLNISQKLMDYKNEGINDRKTSLHPSGPNLSESERMSIKNFIIDLLGTNPVKNFKDIVYSDNFGSLRSIANHLGVSRPTLHSHISTYLEILYGKEAIDDIFKLFWPNYFAKQKEKIAFYEIIEKYIRLYPANVSLIPTRNKLLDGELRGIISKNTFKPWVIDFLVQIKNYKVEESKKIYDGIWGKQCAKRRKIQYEDIKELVYKRSKMKGAVLTSISDYYSMSEYPTDRYVDILCGNQHTFPIQVKKLIYDYNWCPYCNEYFCEKILRNYMSQLFKKEFKAQVGLNKACGIRREKSINITIKINNSQYNIRVFVGQQKFDCFCPDVQLIGDNGNQYKFKVAAEYDGFHHDEQDIKINPYCRSLRDFAKIWARDSGKTEESYKNKIILIRLKETKGFDRKKLLFNRKVVIQEIIRQFNEQVNKIFGTQIVKLKYNPNMIFDPLGERKAYRIRSCIDEFLEGKKEN